VRHVWSNISRLLCPNWAPARPPGAHSQRCLMHALGSGWPQPRIAKDPLDSIRSSLCPWSDSPAHASILVTTYAQSADHARGPDTGRCSAWRQRAPSVPWKGRKKNVRLRRLERAPEVPGMRTGLLALHRQPTVTTCWLGFSRSVDAASYRTASLWAEVGTHSSEQAWSQQMDIGILKLLLSRKASRLLRGPDPMRLGVPERAASWDIQLDRGPEELALLRLGRRW
jgi:hypothetical protein